MPRDTSIQSVLVLGSGPIVIGQAAEFDYSGTQALRALREEGIRTILVNSNPATIMTDPELADKTYIEPLLPQIVACVIEKERPDALLPTVGGQVGLNLAIALEEAGVLSRFGVRLIGAQVGSIKKAEDREAFKRAMERIGLKVPQSQKVGTVQEAKKALERIGLPSIIRPSFTLGGSGGSIAYNLAEFEQLVLLGLQASPVHEVLIERYLLGWKEFELEVMRDKADNVVVVCSIENFDPMGIHTGDSITVAPIQTLTDREYQVLRDAAKAVIREIGVDTGGSNIQFAMDPGHEEVMVIEMNPRVSRSSALASKATGFPIAKIAAKLAIGYTLDEIQNDITKVTPASFEPAIDYVVVKIPRFNFEKFPEAAPYLSPQMKSVGEAMAIGRTFQEALQKALRSLELDSYGFDLVSRLSGLTPAEKELEIIRSLKDASWDRVWMIAEAFRTGLTLDYVYGLTKIDKWFLSQIQDLVQFEAELESIHDFHGLPKERRYEILSKSKQAGFSDNRLAHLLHSDPSGIERLREQAGIVPVYKAVDTCAAEFEAKTPYFYSCYQTEDEVPKSSTPGVAILGSGPNRIGQGIEFDYSCVHGVMALRSLGIRAVMVNCNPETVSTDYDTVDRLYFEPLSFEDVRHVLLAEPLQGAIVQFGGQTPLKLAMALEAAGFRLLGTDPEHIDAAEDREKFNVLLHEIGLKTPRNGVARSVERALAVAEEIGYPVLVRPSYVLGGRAMEVIYEASSLLGYLKRNTKVSFEHPLLIESFLEDAIELDVDAVSDGKHVFVPAIMQHVELAGIHSGDSACSIPPYDLPESLVQGVLKATKELARRLEIKGLLNVQYAIQNGEIYCLEANPRASRTVPFVSKASGVPLAKLATRVIMGQNLDAPQDLIAHKKGLYFVKEAVFPFLKFQEVDAILGPEMKSTGEVMGVGRSFSEAYLKAQWAAGSILPKSGKVFLSVRDADKPRIVPVAKGLLALGFELIATRGTKAVLQDHGIEATQVNKVHEGRPHIVDLLKDGQIGVVINTPEGSGPVLDSFDIRRACLVYSVPYMTTIAGARAALVALEGMHDKIEVLALQDFHNA